MRHYGLFYIYDKSWGYFVNIIYVCVCRCRPTIRQPPIPFWINSPTFLSFFLRFSCDYGLLNFKGKPLDHFWFISFAWYHSKVLSKKAKVQLNGISSSFCVDSFKKSRTKRLFKGKVTVRSPLQLSFSVLVGWFLPQPIIKRIGYSLTYNKNSFFFLDLWVRIKMGNKSLTKPLPICMGRT